MGDTAECVMTKGHIDNPLPKKTFMLDLEVLPLPLNISKTKVSNYHSQVSQVTHRDLLVLTNRVKVSAKAGALTPLDVLVSDQTSLSMALAIPIKRTNTHESHSKLNTMQDLLAFAAVTNLSFKWIETDNPGDQVKVGEPPPWNVLVNALKAVDLFIYIL